MEYAAFKQTDRYGKAFNASEITYIIGLKEDASFKPIGRGSGFNVDGQIEETPVEEYGAEVIEEYVTGKYRLSGRFESFFIPAQGDMLPSTQNFKDKEYVVQMVVAGTVAARLLKDYTYTNAAGDQKEIKAGASLDLDGTVLKEWTGVKFTGKGLNQGANGLVASSAPFVARREYSGDEIANDINAG